MSDGVLNYKQNNNSNKEANKEGIRHNLCSACASYCFLFKVHSRSAINETVF